MAWREENVKEIEATKMMKAWLDEFSTYIDQQVVHIDDDGTSLGDSVRGAITPQEFLSECKIHFDENHALDPEPNEFCGLCSLYFCYDWEKLDAPDN